jgi:hypothetical protein
MAFTKHTFSFIIEKRKAILPKSDSEEKIPPPHIGENQGDTQISSSMMKPKIARLKPLGNRRQLMASFFAPFLGSVPPVKEECT